MSVESISWALNLEVPMDPTTKLVLVGICNHDGDGGSWPKLATLARYAGISERSVRRQLRTLEEMGLITTEVNAGGTAKTRADARPNLYTVHRDGGTPMSSRGGTPVTPRGRTPMSSEPSNEPSTEPSNSPLPPHDASVAPEETPQTVASLPAVREAHEEAFETFWALYGRVGPRKKAHECFLRALRVTKGDPEPILTGLRAWRAYWDTPGAAKVKWPQGWLSEQRWNDIPPPIQGLETRDMRSKAAIQRAIRPSNAESSAFPKELFR